MSAFDRLIEQVDTFIRKFYKNQIVKGLLLFIGVLLFSYLLVITLEYFGRFNSYVRGALFFGFIGVNIYILSKFIVIPTMKLKSFGNRIDRYQASNIIGTYFPNISDRLLNTLQLSDRMDQNSADFELLNASVQQRSVAMSTVPFADAIDLGENKKYLPWVLPVILILFLIGVFSPKMLTQGTERVLNFSQEYAVPPPFEFSFVGNKASIEEGESYSFKLELLGNSIPEKVFIKSELGRFLLTKVSKNEFRGQIPQVRKSMQFHFEANEFNSTNYSLSVIAKTAIGKLQATIIYPPYLGLENEIIENASDLTINEGSEIVWSVLTKNTSNVEFWIDDKKKSFKDAGFSFRKKFKDNAEGKIVLENSQSKKKDTTFFNIDVIKDAYPSIQVEEIIDTLKDGIRYFSGVVGDDNGLLGLSFVYTITGEKGNSRIEKMSAGKVFGTESPFNFAVDFRRENLKLNDQVSYYFVVSDNDGVNGHKTTKSRTFQYRLPSLEELNDSREEDRKETRDEMQKVLNKAAEFKKNLERLRKETLNSKQSNWNKQSQAQQLQEEHKSLVEDLKNLQEEMQNSIEEKNQLSEMDEQLLEQQELINDLLDELMDDEMKALLEELEKLMQEQNKDALEQKLDELEMSSEDMKKQLDRTMEMLKKLQVNEKIDEIEEELKELAKEQENLKKETEQKKKMSESDLKKQDDIKDKFEQIKDDLKALDSLNKNLDRPMELGNQEEKSDEIDEDLKDSKEQLEKDKGKKAGEKQQGASEKMKEMADELDKMQSESNKEQQEEDIDLLRNILESLIYLSFDQEKVMQRIYKVSDSDPAYLKHGRHQRKIVDDTRVVRDSLYALAKRQPKIAKFVDKELNQISVNHDLILEDLDERRRRELKIHQQFVMTSYNNLALMLDESLAQMQAQMKSMQPGAGSCSKPGGTGKGKGGKKPSSSPGDMKEMLKKQLEQMKKGKGPNPGGKKPGDKPGESGQGKPGQNGMPGMGNKQVAKMAAQQGAMRRRLEQIRNEMNKDGKGSGNQLNPLIQELEQQEKDLINKRLGNNLVERQKRILTRLLESEKALMERGLYEKRESKEGNNENYSNQIRFDEYNKNKLRQIELLRAVDPAYNKYYKDRANEYFNKVL
ncbi:MAG: hypothetical protein COA33_014415 [Fluviicola sp.]|nr:hypothetical protein [Fluviicola sp.]